MRVGENPAKSDYLLESDSCHRIIIPIYIPELSGYFSDSLNVLQLCLESLLQSITAATKLSLIDNGSCREVKNYLSSIYERGGVDRLITCRENFGKVDPLIGEMRSTSEPLITISDADVLFRTGWQAAVEKVFLEFPEAGIVSPVPVPNTMSYFTTYTILDNFLTGSLVFRPVVDPSALDAFAASVGNNNLFNNNQKKAILSVERNGFHASVGCGHFVATIKRKVLDYVPQKPSRMKMCGGSETDYIDRPCDLAGLWRLATMENYAYHMGNISEDWMHDVLHQNEKNIVGVQTSYSDNIANLLWRAKPSMLRYLTYRIASRIALKVVNNNSFHKMWGISKYCDGIYK